MSHMVIYRGVDGKPGYHQTDDIHDAVGFVERMRNEEGVEHARIFRLEEVVFEYRPYYRVELTDSMGQPAIAGSEAAALPASNDGAVQVGPGVDADDGAESTEVASESTDVVTDGADVGDGGEEMATAASGGQASSSTNGEVAGDAGSKKGLFGR